MSCCRSSRSDNAFDLEIACSRRLSGRLQESLPSRDAHEAARFRRAATPHLHRLRRGTPACAWGGKGEGALALEEFDGFTTGLVALAGRPVLDTRHHGVGGLLDRLVGLFGRGNVCVELQRHLLRDEECENAALIELARAFRVPIVATNDVRCATPAERPALRRAHVRAAPYDARCRRAAAGAKCGALPQVARSDGGAVLRSSRCARGNGGAGRAARIHDGGSGISVSDLSRTAGGNGRFLPPPHHGSGRARSVSALSRQGPRPDRPRARSHREARSRRLLPDRLGHRQLLPPAGHPRAGPGIGRQQRRLLQPRDHGGRSHQDGAAVRALPVGGTRRVARHRSRSAERRSARAGDSARLREIRAARRGDDGQRHHVSRQKRGARGGEGAVARRGAHRSACQGDARLRVHRSQRDAGAQHGSGRSVARHAARARVCRAVDGHPGSAASSRPAFRRHGDLAGRAGFGGPARACQHARARGHPVGQGRLCRDGDRQGRPARPRDDGRAAGRH